jgi:hypothetical protein
MASQSSSSMISREERLLQLTLLEAEVGKRLELKRLVAEEEALRDRAEALKAYLDDDDEEALARAQQFPWATQSQQSYQKNLMIEAGGQS